MLKIVAVKSLKPNPYRRLAEYPIHREKVEVLKESIASTGFWGTILARPCGEDFEIAFGHHRLKALQEQEIEKVEIIVRKLGNEEMIKIMSSENMEEWGTSAWVELETIRAVIDAYGKGEIVLPPVPKDTRKDQIRDVGQAPGPRSYTQATVAEFLGWTRKHHGNGLRPNSACEVAFKALDMLDDGFIEESTLKGLSRDQMKTLVQGQWLIYQEGLRIAKENEAEAKRVEAIAAKVSDPEERETVQQRARAHTRQAQQSEDQGKQKAKDYGKASAEAMRAGEIGVRGAAEKAQKVKNELATSPKPQPIHDVSVLVSKIAKRLEGFLKNDGDLKLLRKCKIDVVQDEYLANGLGQSFSVLITRLERIRDEFSFNNTSRSHRDGTGVRNAFKEIEDGRGSRNGR